MDASSYLGLTEDQAAKYLGMKANTLNKWRLRHRGPHFLKIGGKIRYRQSDLDAFLESCRVDPATQREVGVRRSRATRRVAGER